MEILVRVALLAVLAGLPLRDALADVVGSSFVSEKDGVIEVNADGWNITDAEKEGGFPLNLIARFTVKAPVAGALPYVDLFRLANPGSQIQAEQFLKQLSDGLAAAMPTSKASPIETRQIGGRRVWVLPVLITQQGVRIQGRTYLMQGEKSLYWAQLYMREDVWEQLEPSVAKLIDNIKY